MRILHVLDHSLPLHSGYAFRTAAILREQRALGYETFHLTTPRHRAASTSAWTPRESSAGSETAILSFRSVQVLRASATTSEQDSMCSNTRFASSR